MKIHFKRKSFSISICLWSLLLLIYFSLINLIVFRIGWGLGFGVWGLGAASFIGRKLTAESGYVDRAIL